MSYEQKMSRAKSGSIFFVVVSGLHSTIVLTLICVVPLDISHGLRSFPFKLRGRSVLPSIRSQATQYAMRHRMHKVKNR
jgi:CRISPR-associated DxTHG motif protein